MFFVLFALPAAAVGLAAAADGISKWRLSEDVKTRRQHRVTVPSTLLLNKKEHREYAIAYYEGDEETMERLAKKGAIKWAHGKKFHEQKIRKDQRKNEQDKAARAAQ